VLFILFFEEQFLPHKNVEDTLSDIHSL